MLGRHPLQNRPEHIVRIAPGIRSQGANLAQYLVLELIQTSECREGIFHTTIKDKGPTGDRQVGSQMRQEHLLAGQGKTSELHSGGFVHLDTRISVLSNATISSALRLWIARRTAHAGAPPYFQIYPRRARTSVPACFMRTSIECAPVGVTPCGVKYST